MPVAPPEPGELGGVPGVLPGTMPLGVSHAERGAIPDGPSDGRRARPELATVARPCATGCGTGVPCGIVGGAGIGVGSCVMITVGGAADGAVGVTLMPGIVGRFFGPGAPSMVALTAAGLGALPIVRSVGFAPVSMRASVGRETAYSPLGRAAGRGALIIVLASGASR